MAPRGKADQDDFDNLDERQDFAVRLREGLDPEGVFDDWGDYEEDERQISSRDDVHYSTPSELETYYDENRPSGWWPL